jgi:hypothetical protein
MPVNRIEVLVTSIVARMSMRWSKLRERGKGEFIDIISKFGDLEFVDRERAAYRASCCLICKVR